MDKNIQSSINYLKQALNENCSKTEVCMLEGIERALNVLYATNDSLIEQIVKGAKKVPENVDFVDFWAKDENGRYFHICEGTGDNLLQEDIADGYVDYIYYSVFDNLNSVSEGNEDDGGMVLLKEFYRDLNLSAIVQEVEETEDVKLEVLE